MGDQNVSATILLSWPLTVKNRGFDEQSNTTKLMVNPFIKCPIMAFDSCALDKL